MSHASVLCNARIFEYQRASCTKNCTQARRRHYGGGVCAACGISRMHRCICAPCLVLSLALFNFCMVSWLRMLPTPLDVFFFFDRDKITVEFFQAGFNTLRASISIFLHVIEVMGAPLIREFAGFLQIEFCSHLLSYSAWCCCYSLERLSVSAAHLGSLAHISTRGDSSCSGSGHRDARTKLHALLQKLSIVRNLFICLPKTCALYFA